MSTYQYYDFLAVDRPLTSAQMTELRAISTRASITPTQFSNEYNYGDLKADPAELLEKYFDVHVYVTNWGTRNLSMKFPADAVDIEELNLYCQGEQPEARKKGDHVLLEMCCAPEEYHHQWEEGGEHWMGELAFVREGILQGDRRALYIAWLMGQEVHGYEDDDNLEPPVPPGLGELSAPLESLSLFFRIDEYFLAAAAEGSSPLQAEGERQAGLREWIAALPDDEKDALLWEVGQGKDGHVGAKLLRRYHADSKPPGKAATSSRTIANLFKRAAALREARDEEEARRAERKRKGQEKAAAAVRATVLNHLAGRQGEAWKKVDDLASLRNAKAYEQAVRLLVDLRDLADRDGKAEIFEERLTAVRSRHERKSSFIRKLTDALAREQ